MGRRASLRQPALLAPCSILIFIIFLLSLAGFGQSAAPASAQMSPEELKKLSAAFAQFGPLMQKMQDRVQTPPPRTESRLLALLPASTVAYAAFPNYGEASHQALNVFLEEVQENAQLRSWWQQGDMAAQGPKIVAGLEKFYQISQYLGDEIVVSAQIEGKGDPRVLVLAECRKPGLKEYLQTWLKDISGKGKPAARVYDAAEFAVATNIPKDDPIILVDSGLVVLAGNISALREFNELRQRKDLPFATVPFGQRLAQAYEGGVSVVAGVDLQTILRLKSIASQNQAVLQRTGFSYMKYLVWTHNSVGHQSESQMELSFTGPRRGVASWIASPGPMGSLDFVSPKTQLALSLLLKNPAEIFDEIKEMTSASNPNAISGLDQMQKAFKVSLRDDLFARLTGEITLEMDTFASTPPAWKLIAKTSDPSGLLATLNKLLGAANNRPRESEENGVTIYTVPIPSAGKMQAMALAVVDGYLILASSREELSDAIHLHHSGESLARSNKLQASLPLGKPAEMSVLLYEDPVTMSGLTLGRISPDLAPPDLARFFSNSSVDHPPTLVAAYADETSLRVTSRSIGTDPSAALVIAAIAIPNLVRARMAANESSAAANIRTANTAQIMYNSAYPQRGFAPDLASLGPDPKGPNLISPLHASLIDASLGDATCTSGSWCVKSGYRFTILTACRQLPCAEYAVVATPVSPNAGGRNFCSTSDAVVRYRISPPLDTPVTAAQCRTWSPLP